MKKVLIAAGAILIAAFQNCSKVDFGQDPFYYGSLGVCNGVSCDLDPLTEKPAVVTILIAMGDEANNQLVVNGASSQLIAETVVRYVSPKRNPKILIVRDSASGSEDPEDTKYVASQLLIRYSTKYIDEPAEGLSEADLADYDIVWFNNPGAPMGKKKSRDTLLTFNGGVILQGDDLSRGGDFDLSSLTGLKYVENGTSLKCGNKTYNHNDNNGEKYVVSLDSQKITGTSEVLTFRYGNDIDFTKVVRPDLEVLAWAKGGPDDCTEKFPAIVRYKK